MNNVVFSGRIATAIELRYTDNQVAIARFSLAIPRMKAEDKEEKADFINVVAFSKIAEAIEKYTKKGNRFSFSGRIQTGSYTNKEGNKVYTTEAVVEKMEIIDWKDKAENTTQKEDENFEQPNQEDIPF